MSKKSSKTTSKSQKSKVTSQKGPKKAAKKTAAKKGTKSKPVKKTVVTKKAAKPSKVKHAKPALLAAVIDGLEERKAKNITVLDLTNINGRSFDYFVIADADSGTHVESIAASAEEVVKKTTGERPFHTEGWQNAEWILLDYINIIVHVFQRPVREFYNLEGLWADAEVEKIN